jgi:NitT/TauT family transport system substrate-binding protein
MFHGVTYLPLLSLYLGDLPMMSLRNTLRAALAALLALSFVPHALADDKKVVLSQAFQSMLYLPIYIAIDNGFFKKAGIEVSKQTAGAPSAALSAVISGSADFSLHGPEWTAIAAAKGAPVEVIANVVNGAAVWIAAAPDLKFNSVKDLRGQTVVSGLMPTTSTSLFLKLLKENGMDQHSVTLTQVQLGSEIGPLVAGQAKVAVLYEPNLEQAAARGMKVVLGFPKLYGAYAFSAISARKNVDPDAAQRFVNGLQQALEYMQTNPEGAAAIARKEFPTLEPAIVDAAVKRMLTEGVYPKNVQISKAALESAMATQIALGNLQSQPDYDTFIVQKYIQPALASK